MHKLYQYINNFEIAETVHATKERKNNKFVTVKTKGFTKGLGWKGFGFGFYDEIKLIRSRFYGGDRAEIYFIFISIQKRGWKWHSCCRGSTWAWQY